MAEGEHILGRDFHHLTEKVVNDTTLDDLEIKKESSLKVNNSMIKNTMLRKEQKTVVIPKKTKPKTFPILNQLEKFKPKILGKSEIHHHSFMNVSPFDENEGVPLTLWDFAGQQVFYSVHHLFLSDNAIYLLCFDMKQFMENTTSEIEILKFWIRSLLLNAKNAPLLLVGTHCKSIKHTDYNNINIEIEKLVFEFKDALCLCSSLH